ncbi:AFL084Wp [Eremothecium gossypii ATCC 10895]|uniref:Monopolar spindle protein 2 n=1 Tax=Eremothecium gossypii (strain ATCC 10895 / CBS 109.51 / FGSC 9923 / NRRL Y-1056) TaxID=284811 RepID=MPS2_EREGS|nr:AFL084Wp [Eremothecium gossypii ATCC 10895]Q755A9.2 RecName: Full=Monopolar spindle protein 2 [Eremothecium gossypii ATCC 10895]AAS53288.2 AFL084Wp [Eremothecium gossypii ATCC 10895]AEY97598.1 FAFL084Wp [Eremothecium gossypii FDAG1]
MWREEAREQLRRGRCCFAAASVVSTAKHNKSLGNCTHGSGVMTEAEGILNNVWDAVDSKQQGFIYAKDMPDLVGRFGQFLAQSLTSRANDEAIAAFASEKPFYKLDKEQFKSTFQTLVGTSLQTAVELAGHGEPRPRLFGAIRRASATGDEQAREELERKSAELSRVRDELDEWKSKYQFLEREFLFYQTHHENSVDSTQHEFIISEMKRTIEEQTRMIGQLRRQVQGGTQVLARAGKRASPVDVFMYVSRQGLLLLMRMPKAAFLLLLLGYFVWYTVMGGAVQGPDPSVALPEPPKQPWWEQNNIISALYWYLTDTFEPSQRINDTVNDNYNSLFGL